MSHYNTLFLAHLIDHNVEFLIIGGQARSHYFGSDTEDLDLWLPLLNGADSGVHKALVNWSATYPNHTKVPVTEPFVIEKNTQVSFPDADVIIMKESDQVEAVPVSARIDILFWCENLLFKEAVKTADIVVLKTISLKILSREHLALFARPII